MNAVAIRHTRPYRAATAADDRSIVFHSGVPFKYEQTINTHNNFVLSLAYSPSGDFFASSGADYKVFVYDGKTGETTFELDNPHKGSVVSSMLAESRNNNHLWARAQSYGVLIIRLS